MNFIWLISTIAKSPKDAMNYMVNHPKPWIGILIGIVGIYSLQIPGAVGSFALGKPIDYPAVKIMELLIKGVIYFFSTTTITYGIAKLFKGNGPLLRLTASIGWSWLAVITICITMVPIFLLMNSFQTSLTSKFIVSVCVLSYGIEAIWGIRLCVNAISQSMNFKIGKTIIVYIISFFISMLALDIVY